MARSGGSIIWVMAGVLGLGGAAASPAALGAQSLIVPGSHWGGLMYPESEPMGQFGLNFDRFTELDKRRDAQGRPLKYNGIDSTIGFNFAAFTAVGKVGGSRALLYRATLQLGYSGEQPSRFFQNDIIHALRDLPPVPVRLTRTALEVGGSLEIDQWFSLWPGSPPFFAGAGAGASTLSSEGFVQAGMRVPRFGPSVLVRAGLPQGGDAFRSEDLADWYVALQGSLRLPLGDWAGGSDRAAGFLLDLIPDLEYGVTYTTGLFADGRGRGIRELFYSVRFSWEPFTFETYNELKDKDRGPTYGARLFVRSLAFNLTEWIR